MRTSKKCDKIIINRFNIPPFKGTCFNPFCEFLKEMKEMGLLHKGVTILAFDETYDEQKKGPVFSP